MKKVFTLAIKQSDMNYFSSIQGIISKDIRSELRTRYAINALLMFVIISVTTILFALHDEDITPEILSGMFWVVVFFTAMSGLSRIFVSEEERGTTLVLHLVASPSAVYAGKLLFNCLLTLVLAAAVSVLYLFVFPSFVVKSWEVFVPTIILGCIGFSSSATIIAAIIAKANTKGTLYPVLSFPLLLPLLLEVMRATAMALNGEPISAALGEFQILISYILVVVAGSYLLFDFVWKE